jgi:hypothetical protein
LAPDRFVLPALTPEPGKSVSTAPHSPQNLNSGGLSKPHLAHLFLSGLPQLPQNFVASGFSKLQLEQRNRLPHRKHGHVVARIELCRLSPAVTGIRNTYPQCKT